MQVIFNILVFIENRFPSESEEDSVEGSLLDFGVSHKVVFAADDFDGAI